MEKIIRNGKEVTLQNITLEDIEELFEFDKNVMLQHRIELSNKYIDTQFPENQKLFNRLQKSIKKNIELTDPKTFKDVKDPITIGSLLPVSAVQKQNAPRRLRKLQREDNKKSFSKKLKLSETTKQKLMKLEKDLKKTGMGT